MREGETGHRGTHRARHGAYPPKLAPATPAEMDARRARKKVEIMRLSKRDEENKMLRARILPPHQYDGEFPEEMRKHGRVLEHGGVYADTALWRRHEAEWEEFMETARGMSIIRKRQIPFPEAGGAALYRHLILKSIHEFNLSEEDAEKFAFRRCAMRWHPDKVMTAVGIRLLPEEYDEVGGQVRGGVPGGPGGAQEQAEAAAGAAERLRLKRRDWSTLEPLHLQSNLVCITFRARSKWKLDQFDTNLDAIERSS